MRLPSISAFDPPSNQPRHDHGKFYDSGEQKIGTIWNNHLFIFEEIMKHVLPLALWMIAWSWGTNLAEAASRGDFPDEKQLASYNGERFENPVNDLYIVTLQNKDTYIPRIDSFVQLRKKPDGQILASLHWPGRRALHALWSPEGQFVIISFRTNSNDDGEFALFRVANNVLKTIALPRRLKWKAFFQDPDITRRFPVYSQRTNASWLDAKTLLVELSVIFKDPKTGYINVSYDVTLGIADGDKLNILSSRQSLFSRNN